MTATEHERVTPVEIGTARSKGPSVQDFLAQDTRPVPASMLDHSDQPQGAADHRGMGWVAAAPGDHPR